MEPEFIFIAPLVAVVSVLAALNVSLFVLRISGRGTEADRVAEVLAPYVRMLKLGGRDGNDTTANRTGKNDHHHEHA